MSKYKVRGFWYWCRVIVIQVMLVVALMCFCTSSGLQNQDTIAASQDDIVSPDKLPDEEETITYKVDPEKPMIALTFDDGPGKHTQRILMQLKQYESRATFFMLGRNVKKYPETVKQMKEIGCELGNHSMNHANLLKLDATGVQYEVTATDAELTPIVGHGATVFRPPYGNVNDIVHQNVSVPMIMWSVDTTDWQRKDVAQITEYVLNTVKDGDIVLMHDIHEFSAEAAIQLIPALIEKGYQLVTVSEMAEARGVTMESSVKYFKFSPK